MNTDIINDAIAEYKLDGIVGLFSGGHHSLVATHVASQHPLFKGAIHINTGTGIPETTHFVVNTCDAQKWELWIGKPATTYEMLIVKMGFPGPSQHPTIYRMLKERPLKEVLKSVRKIHGKNIGMITGAMASESNRRMGHGQIIRKDGVGVWINPLWDWNPLDIARYMKENNLPRNPVKDAMHISGECLCGCFARSEEMRQLEIWYPETAKKIKARQELVKKVHELGLNSIPYNQQQWGHGSNATRGMKAIPDEQMELLPMCWFCEGNQVDGN